MRDKISYPLRLAPVYKEAIWGGDSIAERYARRGAPAPCGESWEVSAHRDGDCVLTNGPLAGMTLSELTAKYRERLVGTAAPNAGEFPLLCKIIDARANLSVQVHPSAKMAAAGAEEKNECWFILHGDAGSELQAGLAEGTTPELLSKALATGEAGELLPSFAVSARDCLYIPSGLVHAIGAGCLVYEVQQSANTTYRLYDWNRVDAAGRARELHIEKGMEAIDWELGAPRPHSVRAVDDSWEKCCSSPYFELRYRKLASRHRWVGDERSLRIVFVVAGGCEIELDGRSERLGAGASCLLPACGGDAKLSPLSDDTAVLGTKLGGVWDT